MRLKALGMLALALSVAGCSGGDGGETSDPPEVVADDGGLAIVVETTTTVADSGQETAPTFDATTDTVPENEDDTPAALTMLDSLELFNSCLEEEGVAFIGAPDPSLEPTDPVNQQSYLDALGFCNNVSGVGAAFQAFQDENASLTTEEIEERNRGLVGWIDCMTGRGYTIDGVTTDDRGLNTPNIVTGPDGEDFLGNDDMGECAEAAIDEEGSGS